jgi:transposase
MQDAEDEPLFAERVAGLDIAKAGVDVAIRVPGDTVPGRRQQETRAFGTTRRELLALADWLRCWGVTKVGMEATPVIWGFQDQESCPRRWSCRVRVCDRTGKSRSDEGW